MRQYGLFGFIVLLVGCAEKGIVDPNSFLLGGEGADVPEKTDPIQALSMPLSLNFIQPKKSVPQRLPKSLAGLSGGNSDYALDEVETTVNEVSMLPLQRINFLLCLLAQSNFAEKVNQGAYQILVNPKRCSGILAEEETDQLWVLNSTRFNNQSSQQVKIWIPTLVSKTLGAIENSSAAMLIELEILSQVSVERPYGQFRMNFSTLLPDQYDYLGNEINTLRGSLWSLENSAGQTEVGFINLGDSFEQAFHFIFNDQEQGRGLSYQRDVSGLDSNELRFVVAFSDHYFYRAEDRNNDAVLEAESRLCLARYEYDLQVQQYRLYHAEETVFFGKSVMAGERLSSAELSGSPLLFPYQHRRANDLNGRLEGVGEEFVLQYDASGELKGLSNVAIVLKAGTVLSNKTGSFILKPERQQQVMASVDESWCADLDIDARFYTADLSLPLEGSLMPLGFGLADQPLLESASL